MDELPRLHTIQSAEAELVATAKDCGADPDFARAIVAGAYAGDAFDQESLESLLGLIELHPAAA